MVEVWRPWMVFLVLPGVEEVWTWLGEPEEPWVGCHLTEVREGGFQNSTLGLVSRGACGDSKLEG